MTEGRPSGRPSAFFRASERRLRGIGERYLLRPVRNRLPIPIRSMLMLATSIAAPAVLASTESRRMPDAAEPPRRWTLDEVVVESDAAPRFREQDPVGTAHQPAWTLGRRFVATDVFVLPDGHGALEAIAVASVARDSQGGDTSWSLSERVAVGLPGRFQLDFALQQDHDATSDHTLGGGVFELRHAIADWNEIWGNPTLALGFTTLAARPDVIEPRLLLGGEICDGWVWGANAGVSWQTSGDREADYELTGAISHTLIDEQLAIGAEAVLSMTSRSGSRTDLETALLMGPSLQWRPVERAALRFAPLVGMTGDSPAAEIHFNFEWEF